MKVGTKLSLTATVLVLSAIGPISYYILNSQEKARIKETEESVLRQAKLISKTALNFLFLNGGNLNLAKIDTSDLVKQFNDLKKNGLLTLYVVFLSNIPEKNGMVLASIGDQDKRLTIPKEELIKWLQSEDTHSEPCHNEQSMCLFYQNRLSIKNNAQPLILTRLSFSRDKILADIYQLRQYLYITVLLISLVTIAAGVLLNRLITYPLLQLKKGTEEISLGNLAYRVSIRSNDEFNQLGGSFNQMAQSLQEYVKELSEKYEELNAAKSIQQTLIPAKLPASKHFLFGASYTPMAQVGGDIFDIQKTKNGFGVLVADVSGHGVPAALITAMIKMVMNGRKDLMEKPIEMVSWLNHSLCGLTYNRFATLIYAFLNDADRSFTFCNAGHPELILQNLNNNQIIELNTKGSLIGLFPDLFFSEKKVILSSRDRLVLYTDGIIEAHSPAGTMYGIHGFHKFLMDEKSTPPMEVCEKLIDDLFSFTGNKENLEDDATIVVVDVI